jgi:branched-chain amino acid aminotransferase
VFVNTENKLIWKNGSFQSWNDSNVHILSHTLHYGTGVFEGVRAIQTANGAAVFRLLEHTERLLMLLKNLILISHTQSMKS